MTRQQALQKLWELDAEMETGHYIRPHQVMMALAYQGAQLYHREQPRQGYYWQELLLDANYLQLLLDAQYLQHVNKTLHITPSGIAYVQSQICPALLSIVENHLTKKPDGHVH